MLSMFALLNSLLLASVALAGPSSLLEAHFARHLKSHRSQPIDRVGSPAVAGSRVEYSSNWAGAVQDLTDGSFTAVTGTFNAPKPSGEDGSAAGAWVGIDGYKCQTAILQTGIFFGVSNGTAWYAAWYEWYPDYAYYFSDNIIINANDLIKATVTAFSRTSGVAIIENLTTGQKVKQELNSTYPLCQEDAEWIVEDFELYNTSGTPIGLVNFANFGTITFTDSTATSNHHGVYTPTDATIIDIDHNHVVLTSVTTSKTTLTIKHL